MNKNNDGDMPAFPATKKSSDGLTKRELFAVILYAGMFAADRNFQVDITTAGLAVEAADELLIMLDKGENDGHSED